MKKSVGVVAATIIAMTAAAIFLLRDAGTSRKGAAEESLIGEVYDQPSQTTQPTAPVQPLNEAEQELDSMPAALQNGASTAMRAGAEFDRMFDNQHPAINFETAKSLHSAFERQDRDSEWAPAKEREISEQYSNNPLAAVHGSPTVTCRSSMCEIKLLSNQVRVDPDFDWGNVLLRPLAQQIANGQQTDTDKLIGYVVHHDEGPEKTAAVLHLTFKR